MKKKYWYHTTTYMCPVCGKEKKYKERMYTKKPKEYLKRNELLEKFDYCNV